MLRRCLTIAALWAASIAVIDAGTEPAVAAEPVLLPAPASVDRGECPLQVRCQSLNTSRAVRSKPASKGFSLTRSVKSMFSKAGNAFKPKSKIIPAADPTRLSTKVGPVGPDVYVAAGRLAEYRGNVENAIAQYEKALEIAPADRNALVTFGRLQQRRGLFAEAQQLYQRAIEARPDDAVAYNDLGLCLDGRGQLRPAIESLKAAVALAPDRKLYRNNLALLLTKAGRLDEAYAHLVHAHGEAVAHYNLGYLLYRNGQAEAAARHIAKSLEIDPALQPAQEMLRRMGYSHAPNEASSPPQAGANVVGQSARRRAEQPGPTPQIAQPGPDYGIRLPQSTRPPEVPNEDAEPSRIRPPEPSALGFDANRTRRSGRFGFERGRATESHPDAAARPTAAPARGPLPELTAPELAPPMLGPAMDPPSEGGPGIAPEGRADLHGNEQRHFNVARFPTIRIPSRRVPAPSRPATTAPVPEKIQPFPSDYEAPQFLPPVR